MSPWAYAWNFFIFGATGYVIFGLNRSPWWIVLPLVLSLWPSSNKCECDDDE